VITVTNSKAIARRGLHLSIGMSRGDRNLDGGLTGYFV
jgi:hypothetical protein